MIFYSDRQGFVEDKNQMLHVEMQSTQKAGRWSLLMIKSPPTIVLQSFHEIADPRVWAQTPCLDLWLFCWVKLSGSAVDLTLEKCAFCRSRSLPSEMVTYFNLMAGLYAREVYLSQTLKPSYIWVRI